MERHDRIYVASRKGLIEVDRGDAGWQVGRGHLLAEPISAFLRDPRDGHLYAALYLGHFGAKLRKSVDGGETWTETALPAYPAAGEEEDKAKAPALVMIWAIVAGGADQPGRLWAGTLPGGLFRSDDSGESWQLVESLWNGPDRSKWFGGGYDHPGIHSILVDPRDSRSLTLAISCGGIWRSNDDGASWRQTGKGLRAAYMPPEQAYELESQDVHFLHGCAAAPDRLWAQHHNGIFRSDDGGETFVEVTDAAPAGFGFAVAAHPKDPETAFFVPGVKDECRIPVGQKLIVSRTRDGGQSFDAISAGLPAPSYDLIYRHALAIDAEGKRLAMGSTTGNLWVSEDGGESWSLVTAFLPPIYQVSFAE